VGDPLRACRLGGPVNGLLALENAHDRFFWRLVGPRARRASNRPRKLRLNGTHRALPFLVMRTCNWPLSKFTSAQVTCRASFYPLRDFWKSSGQSFFKRRKFNSVMFGKHSQVGIGCLAMTLV
jgi:hypothetical protein